MACGDAGRIQIIVVLDGCTDDSRSKADAWASHWNATAGHECLVIEQPGRGPAAARNAGAARATGTVLGFLDDDVAVPTQWLHEHLKRLGDLPNRTVSIGPLLLPSDERLSAWNEWEMQSLKEYYDAMARGELAASPSHLYTANAVMSTALFTEVGGFNESLKRAEDIELGFRLEKVGAQFVFAENAGVAHYAKRSLASWRHIAESYGETDVRIAQLGSREDNVTEAIQRLDQRHLLTRWAVRMFSRSGFASNVFFRSAVSLGVAARRLGLSRVCHVALSASYNVLYFRSLFRAVERDKAA